MSTQERTVDRIARAIVEQAGDPWQAYANCINAGSLMASSVSDPQVFEALKLCAECPVIEQCQEWVNGESSYTGVAAGHVYSSRGRRSRPVDPRDAATSTSSQAS